MIVSLPSIAATLTTSTPSAGRAYRRPARVLGFVASRGDRDLMVVETTRGAEQTISTGKYEVTGRGGKGRELLQRGGFTRVIPNAPEIPQLGQDR